jgi:phage regulator Rha-like protein
MAKSKPHIVSVLADETIVNKIYFIRNQKIMLDRDLAEMYGVETKRLNEAVRRNIERFPEDFMFQLTQQEFENLRSQFATSSWGGQRYPPYAFTEQGVSMLSGVLNSAIAIQVHIQIIRIFTKMRELLLTHKDILLKLDRLEKDVKENKKDIAVIFEALKQLLHQPQQSRKRIGFKPDD